jgi:L-threonylcarbamoyladenylate synthase
MKTEIIKISDLGALDSTLKGAAEVIRNGGLVVFPTETVYGLGGDATNPNAAKKIFTAKGRPKDNPLIIHLADYRDAEKYTYTTELYYKLAERFMPGPLTVILRSRDIIPKETRGGLDTVAVRCPSNPIASALIRLSGVPIAAPSANLSGSPSPTSASHVIEDMNGRVDVIIDGGSSDFGLESTIVKINDDGSLTLLRPGQITVNDLKRVVDKVTVASAVTDMLGEGEVALSPGMKYRHYAPKAPVVLLNGDTHACIDHIANEGLKRIAVICYSGDLEEYRASLKEAVFYDFGDKSDELSQAQLLFAILRAADKMDFDKIYAPLPSKEGIGLALYNRMIRAAAYNIINL